MLSFQESSHLPNLNLRDVVIAQNKESAYGAEYLGLTPGLGKCPGRGILPRGKCPEGVLLPGELQLCKFFRDLHTHLGSV